MAPTSDRKKNGNAAVNAPKLKVIPAGIEKLSKRVLLPHPTVRLICPDGEKEMSLPLLQWARSVYTDEGGYRKSYPQEIALPDTTTQQVETIARMLATTDRNETKYVAYPVLSGLMRLGLLHPPMPRTAGRGKGSRFQLATPEQLQIMCPRPYIEPWNPGLYFVGKPEDTVPCSAEASGGSQMDSPRGRTMFGGKGNDTEGVREHQANYSGGKTATEEEDTVKSKSSFTDYRSVVSEYMSEDDSGGEAVCGETTTRIIKFESDDDEDMEL